MAPIRIRPRRRRARAKLTKLAPRAVTTTTVLTNPPLTTVRIPVAEPIAAKSMVVVRAGLVVAARRSRNRPRPVTVLRVSTPHMPQLAPPGGRTSRPRRVPPATPLAAAARKGPPAKITTLTKTRPPRIEARATRRPRPTAPKARCGSRPANRSPLAPLGGDLDGASDGDASGGGAYAGVRRPLRASRRADPRVRMQLLPAPRPSTRQHVFYHPHQAMR